MEHISHKGRIVEISPETTTVEIISSSACAACHAKSLCGMSENVSKQVMVPTRPGFECGEEVNVLLSRSMGHKAVWLSYIVPLILLVSTIILLSLFCENEFVLGGISVGVVAVWYFIVWLFRDKLADSFDFSMEKL